MMRVLLPTDFSENAFHAISYAAKFFENSTCIFYLVHTYTPPVYRVDYAMGSPGELGLPDEFRYLAEEQLENTRKRIKKAFDNPKHSYLTHAAFNRLEDEILDVVQKENIDLVIMGTQGATGAKEILFGSNTVHVMNKSNVPVIAIPADYGLHAPERILFPTDFEIDFDRANLDFLLQFAKLGHSKVYVLHVSAPQGPSEDQENNRARMEGMMLEQNHEFFNLPDQGLIEAINAFQQEHAIDLIAMVRNKHSFMERLFVEPIIKNMGLHSSIPFMVLPYNL
ncbi:universal stress protein [Flagellimonas beolgyonensis]|uniref:universal stress protein n=1 Tax=Flagellimonas beolgyonensis TaxID=864064 RepID=UPI003D64FBC2